MSDRHRMLPASMDAEQGLICSFLLAPREIGAVCHERHLDHSRFHSPAMATIYSVLSGMWTQDRAIDVVTLTVELSNRGVLEIVGGAAFVSQLFTFLPTAANATDYLDIIQDKRTLREVIRVGTEFVSRAYDEQDNPSGLLQEMAEALAAVEGVGTNKEAPTFKQALMDKLERMENETPDADLIPTGLKLLDWYSPLRRGDMPMIAGERKAGKSILAATIAINVAELGIPVLYFSLEDRTSKVVDRIFAGVSRIPIIRQHTKAMSEREMSGATAAITRLAECQLQIRDDLNDLGQIIAAIRLQKVKWPALGLIIVDYAQLVGSPRNKNDNREREVANVSRTLRRLAMETGAAILLLSQLNSDGESRESRAIEQDCTAAWIVNKPEKEEETNSKRVITIPWQRNGESKLGFGVTFLGHLARMENSADTHDEP